MENEKNLGDLVRYAIPVYGYYRYIRDNYTEEREDVFETIQQEAARYRAKSWDLGFVAMYHTAVIASIGYAAHSLFEHLF